MADAQDLKSWDCKSRAGSSPATGTNFRMSHFERGILVVENPDLTIQECRVKHHMTIPSSCSVARRSLSSQKSQPNAATVSSRDRN
jgi:hypothetical protein